MPADAVAEFDLAGLTADAIASALDGVYQQGRASVVILHVDGAAVEQPGREWELQRYPLPIVASISGDVVGGVFDLALGADVRVATRGARLGPGSSDDTDQCWDRLRLLLGRTDALALDDDGWWPAERAFERGLVTALTGPGEAQAEARRIASVIASRGPIATRLAKEAIWRGLPQHLEQALRFETDLTLLLQTTKDRAEGVAAFLEKREPRFTGE